MVRLNQKFDENLCQVISYVTGSPGLTYTYLRSVPGMAYTIRWPCTTPGEQQQGRYRLNFNRHCYYYQHYYILTFLLVPK